MTKDKILLLKKRKTGRRRKKHKGQFLPLKKEKEKQMRNTDFFILFKREYVKGNIFLNKKRKRKTKSKSIIKKRHTFNKGKKKRSKGINRK